MVTLKATVALAVLATTALASAGTGFMVSRVSMATHVTLSCPPQELLPQLPWALPSGPVPDPSTAAKF